MLMIKNKYYVVIVFHMGSVCVSVVLCHLFVCGFTWSFGHGGLLLFLPPHGSNSDPNVVTSNTTRYIFVYLTRTCIFSRHKQDIGWLPFSQCETWNSNIIFHLHHQQNPVQEWGEEYEDGAVYGVTLRREPIPSPPNPSETFPCCAFVQYRTCKVRRLKAATLDLLVTHLLDTDCQEQDYGKIFLSTYRTFTSTSNVIELLFNRYFFCKILYQFVSFFVCILTIVWHFGK